ncbi:hypothetical protein [Asticcacaulis sp. AC402]|uniref:hypothetical protein n=1 Tax=Asticcacaulis sp. AC402 TaxID=1282361 RepID=UPI0003C3BE68|nr:hypothetical protein [Asticcacaulis sp. AC402]ESQ77610.1 hypothetical protein ABAC402_00340 [Asticcacaulis sp. AC402]
MKLKLVSFLGAFLMASLPAVSYADEMSDEEDMCGWSFPVSSYSAEIGGLSIELPAVAHLKVNGQTVSEKGSQPWGNSINTAKIARTKDEIVITTNQHDCVDWSSSYVYVLDPSGRLLAESEQWSEHEWDGFLREKEGLVFWSEWFCQPVNPNNKPGMSHVFILRNGEKAFVKEDRPYESLCSDKAKIQFRVNALYLSGMKPN